jgi:hypothetical protein
LIVVPFDSLSLWERVGERALAYTKKSREKILNALSHWERTNILDAYKGTRE